MAYVITRSMDKEEIMVIFLRWLMNKRVWENKHTELKTMLKVLPKHLRGEKITKKAIRTLANMGLLLFKVSTHELHVSLNVKKKREIMLFVKQKLI
ncbi:MAG: hypothetical protein ABIG95_01375 [Candidatus Woesearchaeota archaeon]